MCTFNVTFTSIFMDMHVGLWKSTINQNRKRILVTTFNPLSVPSYEGVDWRQIILRCHNMYLSSCSQPHTILPSKKKCDWLIAVLYLYFFSWSRIIQVFQYSWQKGKSKCNNKLKVTIFLKNFMIRRNQYWSPNACPLLYFSFSNFFMLSCTTFISGN